MAPAESSERCLYEILDIARTATADEIRAAYRKLALKLHPDKAVPSGVSQEVATLQFQEIHGAYEVLSDPCQRLWYDSNRCRILHSFTASRSSSAKNSSAATGSSSAKGCDFDLNLSQYFSASVFSGYGDTGKGFFKVYGDLFQTLFHQEIACARHRGTGPVPEAPLIGNLESPIEQVFDFYMYWFKFSTVKYEKGSKKAMDYNETVAQLVDFVINRDKRAFQIG